MGVIIDNAGPNGEPVKFSMGGSSAADRSTVTQELGPPQYLRPYLKDTYAEADRLYNLGPAQYTPWSQVANLNPTQLNALQGLLDFANSDGTNQILNAQSDTVNRLLSGGDNIQGLLGYQNADQLAGFLGNNNLADPNASINRFMYQGTNDPSLNRMVNNAVGQAQRSFNNLPSSGIQNRFGIRDKVMEGLMGTNTRNVINQLMGNAYNNQDMMRLQAINLANQGQNHRMGTIADNLYSGDQYNRNATNLGYQNFQNTMMSPLDLLDAINGVGTIKQQQEQRLLDDATNRWNFNQNSSWDNLKRLQAGINPNPQWGVTTQTKTGFQQNPNAGIQKPNMGASVAGGAITGAATGAPLGPWGAAAGAVLGGLSGYLSAK